MNRTAVTGCNTKQPRAVRVPGVGVLAMVLISPGQRLLHRLTDSILEQLPATFLALRSTRGRTEASPAGRRPPPRPATLTDAPQQNFRTLSVTFRWLSHFFLRRAAQSQSAEVSAHSSTDTHARPLTSSRRPELREENKSQQSQSRVIKRGDVVYDCVL